MDRMAYLLDMLYYLIEDICEEEEVGKIVEKENEFEAYTDTYCTIFKLKKGEDLWKIYIGYIESPEDGLWIDIFLPTPYIKKKIQEIIGMIKSYYTYYKGEEDEVQSTNGDE